LSLEKMEIQKKKRNLKWVNWGGRGKVEGKKEGKWARGAVQH